MVTADRLSVTMVDRRRRGIGGRKHPEAFASRTARRKHQFDQRLPEPAGPPGRHHPRIRRQRAIVRWRSGNLSKAVALAAPVTSGCSASAGHGPQRSIALMIAFAKAAQETSRASTTASPFRLGVTINSSVAIVIGLSWFASISVRRIPIGAAGKPRKSRGPRPPTHSTNQRTALEGSIPAGRNGL